MSCPATTRFLAATLLLLLSAAASAAEYEMLILEVAANGGPARSGFVLTDDTGRYCVEEAMVDEWRVNGDRPQAVVYRGVRYLPVDGFEGSTADFDPASLSLDVTIPPRYLQRTEIYRLLAERVRTRIGYWHLQRLQPLLPEIRRWRLEAICGFL